MSPFFHPVGRFIRFYYDGFRTLSSWGRKVWIIILIKLFLIFIILKLFFFSNFLKSKFDSDEEKSQYVLEQITTPNKNHD